LLKLAGWAVRASPRAARRGILGLAEAAAPLFGTFEFVRFGFVSDFEFRASDLVPASPRFAR
jgi:hypothetical protein